MIYLLIAILLVVIVDRSLPSLLQKLLYPAPAVAVTTPLENLVEKVLATSNDNTISGWLQPPANDTTAMLLVLHGNGENLETMKMGGILSSLSRLNIGYFAIDYPGYGNSSGTSSEENCVEAAITAYSWIRKEYPTNPLIVMGWSLGAGVTFQTVRQKNDVAGIIAISPWTRLADVAKEHYPEWVVNRWLKESYDSVNSINAIDCNLLLIHGENDGIIPFEHGRQLSQTGGDRVTWLPLRHTGHNNVFSQVETWDAIRKFLAKL
ncbi:MAG: alpha/beta hydrolase [Calditrichia bacterium]